MPFFWSHRFPSVAPSTDFWVLSKCHQTYHTFNYIQSPLLKQLDKLHHRRAHYTQWRIICPFRPPSGPVFEEAGSFHKCTYTEAGYLLKHICSLSTPPSVDMLLVVRADVVKQSDDLQTLNSLNNLQQICCSPDVKQRFGHDAGSKMQINLVSICCSLLRSDWIQLRHLSENGRADIS